MDYTADTATAGTRKDLHTEGLVKLIASAQESADRAQAASMAATDPMEAQRHALTQATILGLAAGLRTALDLALKTL